MYGAEYFVAKILTFFYAPVTKYLQREKNKVLNISSQNLITSL